MSERIQEFANKYKLIFEDDGEVGFGRPCVGLISKAGAYLDYNAYEFKRGHIFPYDFRLEPPIEVSDAYHKHDCLCVLVHDGDYGKATRQLELWIEHLESQGELEVKSYTMNHDGMMRVIHGLVGYSLVYVNEDVEGKLE